MSIEAVSRSLGSARLASPVQMIKNLKFIALPAIALMGSYFTPTAQAACDYFECCRSCNSNPDTHPIMILLCRLACSEFCN